MKAQRRFAPAGVAAMDQNRGLLSIGMAYRNQEIGTTTCTQIDIRDAGIYPDRKEDLET